MSILLSEEEMDSHLSQSERKKCMDMQHILLDVLFKEYLQEKNLFVFLCLAIFRFHERIKSPRVAGPPVVGKCPIPGLHQTLLTPHPGNDRAQKRPAFGSEDN